MTREEAVEALTRLEISNFRSGKSYITEAFVMAIKALQTEPKKGYISIADVMSVFDDFMCGDVDEDGTEIFLEMLKDKAESEDEE